MFKSKDDITKFIDNLEKFVRAVVTDKFSKDVEDSIYLNRMRDKLQNQIEELANLAPIRVDESKTFECPECGGEMVVRTRRSDGGKFWGCKKYPVCNGTRDSDGLSRAERVKERQIVQQDTGFSFNRPK